MNERDNAGMLDTVDEFEVGALEDSRDTLKLERVTHQGGKNLHLTEFRQFQQLVGHYCSWRCATTAATYCLSRMMEHSKSK